MTFIQITTLENWPDITWQIIEHNTTIGWLFVGFIIVYILFTNMLLLNLVTGVIVDSVLQFSTPVEDKAVEDEAKGKKRLSQIATLHKLADLADEDRDGILTAEELERALASPDIA